MTSQIEKVIADQTPESLHLEFKRAIVLLGKKRDDVCKAVSAMANSDGGRIIFGVAEDKASRRFTLDDGVDDVPRVVEWLDNTLSDNISPRIVGFSIQCEVIDEKNYLFIDVPKSTNAPHQSADKLFFKRSNSRSFPMEAYEIDDIRNRRYVGPPPLVIEVHIAPNQLMSLLISNCSDVVCRDLAIDVASNFDLIVFDHKKEGKITLSRIGVGQEVRFPLDSPFSVLQACKDAALNVSGVYKCDGRNGIIQVSDRISIAELERSLLPEDDKSGKLKKIADEIHELRRDLQKFSNVVSEISETIAGSGLRISPYSISQLRPASSSAERASVRYNVHVLTLDGMAEVLETTTDVISKLYDCFQYMGGGRDVESALGQLPGDVAERARSRLNMNPFGR